MKPAIPITASNPDGIVRVVVIGRLSQPKETEEETLATIESSYLPVDEYLKQAVKGPLKVTYLGEQISGYVADRRTILEVRRLIEDGECDLAISEDLSRVSRNPRHQQAFVQDCVDAGVRVICLADDLDTADDNWEMMLSVCALRHGMHVPDTRRRSKRKAIYSFKNGGMALKVKFGYRKLTKEEAESGHFGPKGLREVKVPECTRILHEVRRLAMENFSATSIVDWLIQHKVDPGPYVKGRWRVAILKSVLCDPKLHGWRFYKKTEYQTIYRTGKMKRSKNASPERLFVPELAHMTLEEQTTMVAALGWEIDWNDGKPKRASSRRNVPRGKSLWPGQAATCAICGRTRGMLMFGAHLRCRNSTKENGRQCWNHVQVPIELTRKLMIEFLVEKLRGVPAAWDAMIDAAWAEYKHTLTRNESRDTDRKKSIQLLQDQQKRLVDAITLGGDLPGLVTKLADVEKELNKVFSEMQREQRDKKQFPSFETRECLEAQIPRVLGVLISTSFRFANVLRQFFPVFQIQPVQALDSGQVRPRAKIQLKLPASHPQACNSTPFEFQLDLFAPPKHISLMPKVVAARNRIPRPTMKEIAAELSTSVMTVKRALRYSELMKQAGVDTPFVELLQAPKQAARWRHAT